MEEPYGGMDRLDRAEHRDWETAPHCALGDLKGPGTAIYPSTVSFSPGSSKLTLWHLSDDNNFLHFWGFLGLKSARNFPGVVPRSRRKVREK